MKTASFCVCALILAIQWRSAGEALPVLAGSRPLQPNPDFSAAMVEGIDRFLLREIENSRASRKPDRERLKAIIGAVDPRVPIKALELVGDTTQPALVAETDTARVLRVRWPVLDGVHGEGLLIQPKGKVLARVIYIPDADTPPEKVVDVRLVTSGCEIVIPALISRDNEFSTNAKFGVKTNAPHREWIYRQSYELGRHIIGYEVLKMLSLMDYFETLPDKLPVLISGLGEGGMIAMYAGAIDTRFCGVYTYGCFGPREGVWEEPLDRNVFGLLRDFGDAEIASLIAPRPFAFHDLGYPQVAGPKAAEAGKRSIAAPGKLTTPPRETVIAEVARARRIVPGDWIQHYTEEQGFTQVVNQVFGKEIANQIFAITQSKDVPVFVPIDKTRQERQVRELEAFTQRLLVSTEMERNEQFWRKLPLPKPDVADKSAALAEFEKHTAAERDRFWNDVIGRFPDPNQPMNPKSRLVRETDAVAIYEITLDVWPDVFAWGWLCLPKNLKPGEKRPVVVCQHGLEGIPEDTITDDESSRAWKAYKSFALRLAEQGFVTFAPHNPYRGQDKFRTLQRKLNPLGKTLFSIIFGQHQQILAWLKQQSYVDPQRIAFYGLSYGGKSAMRIPAVLTDYCLSICSADFNEWVRKCVSTDLPMSYIHTGEYEIWEWNLGRTFNYAEMAALIAPRPFMVERGHDDGVGIDEWVNYEFAKIRRLYNKLGIGDRTTIEHFNGPHTINGVGTYQFLREKLAFSTQ